MRKTKKILLSLGLILSSALGMLLNCNVVHAETYSGQAIWPSEMISNVYIRKERPDGYKKWQQGRFIRRSEDNKFVYCLQPYVDINNNYVYNVARSDYEVYLNMTKEQFRKINLIAYYGYGYGNHTDHKWYAITQVMIWRMADPSSQFYFTDTLNGNRNDSLFANEINEINNLVNSHYTTPQFNEFNNLKLPMNHTISVNDVNGKLSEYRIASQNNVSASINGNTLNITGTGIGQASISLTKSDTRFDVPPVVYFNDHSQNVFRLGSYDPTTVNLNLEVVGGKIKIRKVDNETNSTTAQGDASLIGAKYQVIDSNNNVVATLTIGDDNTATTNYLPFGEYKIKEIENSKGYLIDNNIQTVTVNSSDTVQTDVKEQVIKNYISILKQYDYVDGTTQFLNAEKGITFEIYNSKNELFKTITTDKNGYATIELPYGVYKLHQVNTNTGYEKIFDFYITVDENSEKEQYYNILNNKLNAYLQLFKKDSETGKTIELADTTFKILNTDTNQYVSQYVGGKVYSEFKTDKTGKFITYLKLEAGNYKLVEIKSPKGYLINEEGLTFTLGNGSHINYTNYGAFITVEYKNTPIKGQIEIHKTGEVFTPKDGTYTYVAKNLSDVEFSIYAEEDIKTADGQHIYYEKGTLVDTVKTNKDGYAISKKLPLGKYYVVETKTQENYVLETKQYHFELTEKDNKTAVVYKSLSNLNIAKKGSLEFSKTDLTNGDVIPNTKIEIYTEKDELIYTGVTDKEGKIKINNLPIGKFYIIETEPATGYVITDEKVYFEIKENNEIVKANMKNKPIIGSLEFTKTDLSNDEALPNTKIEIYNEKDELVFSGKTDEEGKIKIDELRYGKYYIIEKEAPEGYTLNDEKMYFEIKDDGEVIKSNMKDKKITGTLEFTKVDISNDKPLPNTLIEIYNEKDELIFSGRTDENGKVIIKDLEYGKYYILEKEAPEGYTLNDEKMYFEIKEDGEVIKSIMKDEKIVEVPNTDKTDYTIPLCAGLMVISLGIIIYDKTKKRKNK